jgi:hypothetical protein
LIFETPGAEEVIRNSNKVGARNRGTRQNKGEGKWKVYEGNAGGRYEGR